VDIEDGGEGEGEVLFFKEALPLVGAVVVVLDPEESAEELGSTTSKTPYGI
jgi:hypothetical protein